MEMLINHWRPVGMIMCACVCLCVAGCDSSAQGDSATTEAVSALSQSPNKEDPPQVLVDGRGRRYLRSKKATIATAPFAQPGTGDIPSESTDSNGNIVQTWPPQKPEVDVANMTVLELAQNLKTRLLKDGYEYIQEEPDIETAYKIKNGLVPTTTEPGPVPPAGQSPQPASSSAADPSGLDPRYIIGSDNRIYVGGNVGWPNSTQLWLQGCGCSATMIGRRFAVTAAHCLYNRATGSWCNPSAWIAATDVAQTSIYPIPQVQVKGVPDGWINNGSWSYDYGYGAFWNFPYELGDYTSWMGTSTGSPSGVMEMVGYPGDKPYPQMWAKSGNVTSTQSTRLQHNLDIVGGDSGAGLYSQGSWYVFGIQSTENWSRSWNFWGFHWDYSYWNEATRFTSSVSAFLSSSGYWP